MELVIALSSEDFVIVVAGLLSLLRRQRGAGEFGAVGGELRGVGIGVQSGGIGAEDTGSEGWENGAQLGELALDKTCHDGDAGADDDNVVLNSTIVDQLTEAQNAVILE
jgi:hypothetical protein